MNGLDIITMYNQNALNVESLDVYAKNEILKTDFTVADLGSDGKIHKAYMKLKNDIKASLKDDSAHIIAMAKKKFCYCEFRAFPLEEFISDCGKFDVTNEDLIIAMLGLKVSTFVNTGECYILQLGGDSNVGKTYNKTVLTHGMGFVPVMTSEGSKYYKSLSSMGGTPMVAVYSNEPEDKSEGIIMDFDDQRNMSDGTCQIFLQTSNFGFMEAPVYKAVVNQRLDKRFFAVNQRFVITAVHIPKVLLDAGMGTRCLKIELSKQDALKLQRSVLSAHNLTQRLENFCKKWSMFWVNLYDAVYFKGKRTALVVPKKFTDENAEFLGFEGGRENQHIKTIAAVYALFRDPFAVLEGRNLLATEEEIYKARDFVKRHVRIYSEDSILIGNWIEGSVEKLIAEMVKNHYRQHTYVETDELHSYIQSIIDDENSPSEIRALNDKNKIRKVKSLAKAFLREECLESKTGHHSILKAREKTESNIFETEAPPELSPADNWEAGKVTPVHSFEEVMKKRKEMGL